MKGDRFGRQTPRMRLTRAEAKACEEALRRLALAGFVRYDPTLDTDVRREPSHKGKT